MWTAVLTITVFTAGFAWMIYRDYKRRTGS